MPESYASTKLPGVRSLDVGAPLAIAGLVAGGAVLVVVAGGAWWLLADLFGPRGGPVGVMAGALMGIGFGVWAAARYGEAHRRLREQRTQFLDEIARIQRREQVGAALLDASSAAVLALDEGGTIVASNMAAERIFGYEAGALHRGAVGGLLPDLEELSEEDAVPRVSAAGEPLGQEWRTRGRHRDQTVFPVLLERVRVPHLAMEVVTVREATSLVHEEQQRVREALRVEQERLVRLSKHRAAFLRRVGDELREHLDAVQRGVGASAEDGAHAMHVIVDKLSNLGMVDDAIQDLHIERVCVPEMIDELVCALTPLVCRNHNTLDVRVSEQVPLLATDRQKLAHAVRNLISNAARYTRGGTISIEVVVEPGRGMDWVAFFVSDTGEGLGPKELDRLFEAFSLPDAASTQAYLTVGTGLALSQYCARRLGGHIAVRSASGEGSTFTLRLPLLLETPL